jgi:hypothetical protein
MKKERKSEAQIAAERAEAEELRSKIIAATNTIPVKVRNEASYQAVVSFKNFALEARKAAESKRDDVMKLRAAWSLISGYYA